MFGAFFRWNTIVWKTFTVFYKKNILFLCFLFYVFYQIMFTESSHVRHQLSLRVSLNKEDDIYEYLADQVSLTPACIYGFIGNLIWSNLFLNVMLFLVFLHFYFQHVFNSLFVTHTVDKRLSLKFAFAHRLLLYLFGIVWFRRVLGICLLTLFLLTSVGEPSNYMTVLYILTNIIACYLNTKVLSLDFTRFFHRSQYSIYCRHF